MKTETTNGGTSGGETDLPVSRCFDLLRSRRRRFALHYLSTRVGAVPLTELAEQIALWEGVPTPEWHARICTGLHHADLPALVDAGVVRYEPTTECVELLEGGEQLAPFLSIVEQRDLGCGEDRTPAR